MSKYTRLSALTLAAALVAAACGGPKGSDDGGASTGKAGTGRLPTCPVSALPKAKGKVKVTLWYSGLSAKPLDTLLAMVKAYNANQDKVALQAENQGQDYDSGLAKVKSAVKTKELPQLTLLENTALPAMVDSGIIFPAEACMKASKVSLDDIEPAVRAYYTVGKTYWPGYVNVSEPILYYNKAAFIKAGLDPEKPPTNFAELRAVAEKLKASGVPKPLALSLKRWFIESWLNGSGQSVVNADDGRKATPTKASIDTPQTVKILKELKSMADDGLLQGISNTPGNIDQYLALQGNSAMTIETSTASTSIAAFLKGDLTGKDLGAGDLKVDPSQLKAGSASFPGVEKPGRVSVGGGAFFLFDPKVYGGTPEQLAGAWDFLRFMGETKQAVQWHVQGSYLPSVKAVNDSPAVKEFATTDVGGALLKPAREQLAQIDPAKPGPLIGPYKDYGDAVEAMFESVMLKGTDPATAAKTAQARITDALQKYKEDNG